MIDFTFSLTSSLVDQTVTGQHLFFLSFPFFFLMYIYMRVLCVFKESS